MKRQILLFVIFLLLFGTLIGISFSYDLIVYENIGLLEFFAVVIFIIVLAISLLKFENYLTALIFIIFGFPANVNNLFPGIPLGLEDEIGSSSFPILTHIELFLIFGILRYYNLKLNCNNFYSAPLTLIVLLTLSYAANIFKSNDELEFGLMVAGSYQIRILILFLFILSFDFKSLDLQKVIVDGLKLSLVFLFIESSLYTFLNGRTSLTSGSLGVNTFGNILAAIGLYFLVMRLNTGKKYRINYFWITLPILMSIGTGTRMSIIAFLFGFLIYNFPIFKLRLINILVLLSSVFIYYFLAPDKFNIFQLINAELITYVFNDYSESGLSGFRTDDNSSLITRLLLFRTSINMIFDNFFLGIGAGKWNYLKNEYGFLIPVLIDSHNGYLSAFSQYGLIAGSLFISFIMIKPVFLFSNFSKVDNLYLLGSIPSVMLIAEFSNSGLFKIQVFSLLTFIAIVLYIQNKR